MLPVFAFDCVVRIACDLVSVKEFLNGNDLPDESLELRISTAFDREPFSVDCDECWSGISEKISVHDMSSCVGIWTVSLARLTSSRSMTCESLSAADCRALRTRELIILGVPEVRS